MKKRHCAKCKLEYPATLEYFYRRKGKNRSETALLCYCKFCFNEIQKHKHNELKQKLLDYKGNKCIICGYNKCNAAMDFHHINPTEKEIKIGQTRKTFEVLRKELDKCVIMCRNCHAETHQGFNPKYLFI
jgi:hypothetical protein